MKGTMRTREEMEAVARGMESIRLLDELVSASERCMYAVESSDGMALNHTAEEWDVVVQVVRAEILRRMGN